MLRGLTTAASGMLADERLQQALANNLANSETPGYKSTNGELLAFPEQLQHLMDYGGGEVGTIGKMGTGVTFQEGVPQFIQGQLQNSGRNLDVAIVDSTPNGTYAAVSNGQAGGLASAVGTIAAGAQGRLEIGGVPVAVIGQNGQAMQGVFAVKNPQYQGQALFASDGKPDYDASGQPSYVFANANGTVIGAPGQPGFTNVGLRVGTQDDMGNHSFFAVAFQSPEGKSGIALTRDGHFDVTSNNLVVDASGNYVLPIGNNGLPITNARIQVNPNYTGKDLFNPDGTAVTDANGQASYRIVDANGNPLPVQGRLGTVDADVTTLNPLGQTEFIVGNTLNAAQVTAALRPSTGTMKPGEVEQSNVDVTSAMVNMTSVIASYEANQRVIQTYDTELQKAVEDVGKVNA